ncbi:MAG: MFS transporter, partial [Rhodospirillales bacterium]
MADASRTRTILGHPPGLAFLVFAEAWERFSFYGMQSLLVLYMGQFLLLPEHVGHVAGFQQFRAVIATIYGPLSPAALASVIFGLYAGSVYLTPLAGGLLADRLLGRTATVSLGAILMAAGHFLMAFEASFLMALACLLVGVGCFKGNIATQVGELYGPGDLRRADAFQIYLLGVNLAVIVAPLVCGTLGQALAWRWGFAAAGVGMLIGLATYLSGLRWLPAEPRWQPSAQGARPNLARGGRLARGEGKTVLLLVALLPALVLAAVANLEIFNAYLVWGNANYDLVYFGHSMPVTWLISLDAFIGSGLLVLSLMFWRWWARRRREPEEITKLLIGTAIAAAAPLLLAAASQYETMSGHKVGLAWGISFHILNDIGFVNIFPVGLALFSRVAPRAVAGLMIAVYFLHLFLANMLVGWLGGLLERMAATQFWLLHAGIVATGAVLLLIFRIAFKGMLTPTIDPGAVSSQSG